MKNVKVSVCGCSLVDHLYTGVSFDAPELAPYRSKWNGDGGLAPGKLVFSEDLEQFAKKPYDAILSEITHGKKPDVVNLGGPAIIGAVTAAQILQDVEAQFRFFGVHGEDDEGEYIRSVLEKTPVDISNYWMDNAPTPTTDVLSDPEYNGGKGERLFINRVGVSAKLQPGHLEEGFFDTDVVWFAATALVPGIHDHLTALLKEARARGCVTVVSTVYDFRNEKKSPDLRWPLGESIESYENIDLLIVDHEEALRLTCSRTIREAADFFIANGVSSLFITNGGNNFYFWSDGLVFKPTDMTIYSFPVSDMVDREIEEDPSRAGDTTGCGDNFAGGVVSSLVRQIAEEIPPEERSYEDAAAWGACAGGVARLQVGGLRLEENPGDTKKRLQHYVNVYFKALVISELNN